MQFGVDEAGKGPVLGSMFAAAVYAEPSALPDGVGDSKTIPPARREDLAGRIRDVAAVGVAEVPVERIDDPATDMNSLTVDAHARAVEAALDAGGGSGGAGPDPVPGTVDAGDTDAGRFGARVTDRCDVAVEITARHGADETDPLVGAASVVAKVERDAHVERVAEAFGDVGSGYPSDPTTRTFLREYVDANGALPPCARASWSTCDDVLAAAEQSALDEF